DSFGPHDPHSLNNGSRGTLRHQRFERRLVNDRPRIGSARAFPDDSRVRDRAIRTILTPVTRVALRTIVSIAPAARLRRMRGVHGMKRPLRALSRIAIAASALAAVGCRSAENDSMPPPAAGNDTISPGGS